MGVVACLTQSRLAVCGPKRKRSGAQVRALVDDQIPKACKRVDRSREGRFAVALKRRLRRRRRRRRRFFRLPP